MIDSFLDGIRYLINEAIEKASYDKVKNGTIIKSNEDGTYIVLLDSKQYRIPSLNKKEISVNEIVKVLIPQNNYNEMFILNL